MPKKPIKTAKPSPKIAEAKRRAAITRPVILLLHGFRGNHLGLAETASLLKAAGYEVLVPDIPPALSEKTAKTSRKKASKIANTTPTADYSPKAPQKPLAKSFFTKDGYADWVANFIRKNHLRRPILVGHSMGSIITAATAEKYPELINSKVIFLAPISVKPPKFITNLAPLTTVIPNKPTGYITTKYLLIQKSKLKPVLNLTYSCAEHTTGKRDVARAAKFSSTYAISDFNLGPPQSYCFIAGETDRLNSKEATSALAKKLHAKLVFLKDSGHLINYECPDLVATEIRKFIEI